MTFHTIEVTANDPEYEPHHQYEVKHPARAEHARHIADRHRHRHEQRGGDPDAYEPLRAFPCPGILRIANRELKVWTIQCDVCGTRWGAPRGAIDRDLLVNHRMHHSRLSLAMATATYEKTPGNEAARAVCRVLIERWGSPQQPHPPMLVGPTGRGKTHLLMVTAHQLVNRHLAQVRYWTFPEFLAAARRRMDQGGEGADEFVERQAGVQLLILDDLGAEQDTPWGREVLQRVVDARDRLGLSLMGATNLAESQWADRWGARTASRINGMTTHVGIEGEDWRETRPPVAAGNVVPLHPNAPHTDHT